MKAYLDRCVPSLNHCESALTTIRGDSARLKESFRQISCGECDNALKNELQRVRIVYLLVKTNYLHRQRC